MAELSETDRARVWRGLMRFWSRLREAMALDKGELRAAVDATDGWIDNNQAAFNAELPAVAQAGLTAGQKALLLCAVVLMRVDAALARRVFGEVD